MYVLACLSDFCIFDFSKEFYTSRYIAALYSGMLLTLLLILFIKVVVACDVDMFGTRILSSFSTM